MLPFKLEQPVTLEEMMSISAGDLKKKAEEAFVDQDFAEATKAHEDAQNAFSAYLSGQTLE